MADYVNNLGYQLERRQDPLQTNSDSSQLRKPRDTSSASLSATRRPVAVRPVECIRFYKHLESDAVVDGFTDSDFHLGGTNAKGWISGVNFGLGKNTWLTARWLTANEISGPPLSIDVFQFDINARF